MSKKPITEKTTWREFMDNPFLHSSEIPKDGINVTIVKYDTKSAYSKETGKQEDLHVMYTREFKKPIVMSNRKAKQVSNLFGPKILMSVGKTIHLFSINEKFFGKWGDVLHFKAEIVKTKEPFNSKSAGWDKACEAFSKGKSSIDVMEKHYTLTAATKKLLTDLLPKNEA